MMKSLRVFLLVLMTVAVMASDPLGADAEAPVSCICSLEAIGSGVCGADGNTYANDCLAGCAGVAVVAQGPCALHANVKLFTTPDVTTASSPTPLSASLVNLYASEGFRLVGRAEATAVIRAGTPPPEPTGTPVDPATRYAALRLDVATGLLFASNGTSITEQASLLPEDSLQTPEGRPTKRTRRSRRAGPANVASEAGLVAPAGAVLPQDASDPQDPLNAASILGTDTRSRVSSAPFPFSAVVALQGSTYCSGAMFNTHAVLTSAHCVFSPKTGWISTTSLIVAPGAHRTCSTCTAKYPCGTVPARTVTAYAAYTSTFDPSYDLAVIRLNKDVGACTGWFGVQANTGTYSGVLNTAGYPGDKPTYDMWSTSQTVTDSTRDAFLAHNLDTTPGQSGSPLWKYTTTTNARHIHAVHGYGTGGGWSLNRGVAITSTDFTSINQWGA